MPTTSLFLTLCMLAPQESLPDAATLLDLHEVTLGKLEARAAVHGLDIRGTLEAAGIKASFEERHLLARAGAERVRLTVTYEGWGSTTQGTDGSVAWSTDPAFGIMVEEGPSQGAPRRFWGIVRSAPWRTMYASARTLGTLEREGRKLFELEMQPREGDAERWYLDAETHELARVALVFPGPNGERLPMEFAFADWKEVDGVRYPHRRIQEVMNRSICEGPIPTPEAQMSIVYVCEFIGHASFEPADVAPPEEVAKAIADPERRTPAPSADPEACSIEQVEKQFVATIRMTIPAAQVSQNLAVILPEVGRFLAAKGIQPTGPPFSRYHRIDHEKMEIEIEAGIAVGAAFESEGRVQSSKLPGGRTATTWHQGSYHLLQKSYDRLGAWIEDEGLEARGPFWEIYWTDPGLEPDMDKWRTQILWPVE